MEFTVGDLAQTVAGELRGDAACVIEGVCALESAAPHQITFAADEQHLRELAKSGAEAAIVSRSLIEEGEDASLSCTTILVDDAQRAFIEVLELFHPSRARPEIGIATTAHVDESASIGESTNIHPGAFIDANVVIGAGCDIHPGVVIGADCRIGDQVTIHANTVLYPEVSIGRGVTIHSGAVIGADGFGYRFENGRFEKIPHVGTVRIEDDVEIGAGATIDRGMIGPTVIGSGTKIDNLVMIAHNCEIGRHNAFASQVGFAGSVATGDFVRCGGQVGVADHTHLGEGCSLGAGAGVHKDIPAGKTYLGYPARPADDQLRIVMAQSRLPEMRKQLRELTSRLADLSEQINTITAGS